MTGADTFFGNRAVVTVAGAGGSPTAQTIAVAKGVECTVTFEHVELYGMGTIMRVDVAKHSAKVDFKLKFAKFDPTLANYFMTYMLSPGSAAGTITDTNTEQLFTVTYKQTGTAGTIFDASITGVYFEDFPFPSPENDFTVIELTGHGSAITITNS